jgi:hypothetical protein
VENLEGQVATLQSEMDTVLDSNITFASGDEIALNPTANENKTFLIEGGLVSYSALN